MTPGELERLVITLEEEMFAAAEELRFEYAAKLRDEIKELRRELDAAAPARLSRPWRSSSSSARRAERAARRRPRAASRFPARIRCRLEDDRLRDRRLAPRRSRRLRPRIGQSRRDLPARLLVGAVLLLVLYRRFVQGRPITGPDPQRRYAFRV